MTTVDPQHERSLFTRGVKDSLLEAPRIVVLNEDEKSRPEVYLYSYGQRLSFKPETANELWDWCMLYLADPLAALIKLGFVVPTHLTLPRIAQPVNADHLLQELEGL